MVELLKLMLILEYASDFVCLFVLMRYVQVNNFSVLLERFPANTIISDIHLDRILCF